VEENMWYTKKDKIYIDCFKPDPVATFSMLYDYSYLYIFVNVYNKEYFINNKNIFQSDGITIYWAKEKKTNSLFFSDNKAYKNGQQVPDIEQSFKQDQAGYVLEAKIAWQDLEVTPQKDADYGFNIQINNYRQNGKLKYKASWTNNFFHHRRMGLIHLDESEYFDKKGAEQASLSGGATLEQDVDCQKAIYFKKNGYAEADFSFDVDGGYYAVWLKVKAEGTSRITVEFENQKNFNKKNIWITDTDSQFRWIKVVSWESCFLGKQSDYFKLNTGLQNLQINSRQGDFYLADVALTDQLNLESNLNIAPICFRVKSLSHYTAQLQWYDAFDGELGYVIQRKQSNEKDFSTLAQVDKNTDILVFHPTL
jgi:hypothetical protein